MSNENNIAPINEDLNVVKSCGHKLGPQVQPKNYRERNSCKRI